MVKFRRGYKWLAGLALAVGVVSLLAGGWLADRRQLTGRREQDEVLLSGPSGQPENGGAGGKLEQATVTKVIDGDTVELNDGRRVRYVGIDAPELEPRHCLAEEAKRANAALVQNRVVKLEKDVSEVDKYGRLLRYVYVNGVMVNESLVRGGWAKAVVFLPDVKYTDIFRRAEIEARKNRVGWWGRCDSSRVE